MAVVVAPRRDWETVRAEIEAGLRVQLAGYKLPKAYLRVDAMPLNPGGKIAKGEVRDLVARW